MGAYLLKRAAVLSATLLAASLVIFLTIEVIPGDPASLMLGINAQPDTVAALRAELGLDRAVHWRYFSWITGMVQGDFGTSFAYRTPVLELMTERLTVSLPLAMMALCLAILLALPLGIMAAASKNRFADIMIMTGTQIGIAIPNFWFAILLVFIFAIELGWFSAGGFPGWDGGIFTAIKALLLPAVSLALPQAAILARIMRGALRNELQKDYIRTARAKGLSYQQSVLYHGLRNALLPVLAIIGMQFSFLLAGAIIIENVFYLPGLGRLIFQAIAQRDLILVESAVFLLVFAVVLVTFLMDILYVLADPRLRRGQL